MDDSLVTKLAAFEGKVSLIDERTVDQKRDLQSIQGTVNSVSGIQTNHAREIVELRDSLSRLATELESETNAVKQLSKRSLIIFFAGIAIGALPTLYFALFNYSYNTLTQQATSAEEQAKNSLELAKGHLERMQVLEKNLQDIERKALASSQLADETKKQVDVFYDEVGVRLVPYKEALQAYTKYLSEDRTLVVAKLRIGDIDIAQTTLHGLIPGATPQDKALQIDSPLIATSRLIARSGDDFLQVMQKGRPYGGHIQSQADGKPETIVVSKMRAE